MLLEEKVYNLLRQNKKTLSLAESCSGGLLSNRLTNIPGISAVFKGGFITYCNDVKKGILGIPPGLLKRHGAVSFEVASAMSRGVRKRLKSDFGIGISGIAGPSGGTKSKPVGLTFIAVSTSNETLCLKCLFKGSRRQVKNQAATLALKLLSEFLQ